MERNSNRETHCYRSYSLVLIDTIIIKGVSIKLFLAASLLEHCNCTGNLLYLWHSSGTLGGVEAMWQGADICRKFQFVWAFLPSIAFLYAE